MPAPRGGKSGAAAPSVPAPSPDTVLPILTSTAISAAEAAAPGGQVPEIKAYKLGKRRWSYNQCELSIVREGGGGAIEVVEAVQYAIPSLGRAGMPPFLVPGATTASANPADAGTGVPLEDASVTYQVRLANGQRLRVVVYVVYDAPEAVRARPGGVGGAHAAAAPPCSTAGAACTHYQWTAVARSACRRGCCGPVLRSIQRFGRLGRRSGVPDGGGSPGNPGAKGGDASPSAAKEAVKEARFLYLSIDEAGTHVGARSFRLVLGAYDAAGSTLLGSSVSPPIRVLANNDVPTGAAFISLSLPLRADWPGWDVPVGAGGAAAGAGSPGGRGRGCLPGVTPPGRVALAAKAAAAAAAATAAEASVRPAILTGVPAVPGAARPAARGRGSAAAAAAGVAGAAPAVVSGAAPAHPPSAAAAAVGPPAGLASLLLSHALASSMHRDPKAAAAAAAAGARPSPLGPAGSPRSLAGGMHPLPGPPSSKRARLNIAAVAAGGGAVAPPPPPPVVVAASAPTPGGGVLHTLAPAGLHQQQPILPPPGLGLLRTSSGPAVGPAGNGGSGSLLLAALGANAASSGGGGGGADVPSSVALSPLWRSGSFAGLAGATGLAGSGAWLTGGPTLSGGMGGGGSGLSADGGLVGAPPPPLVRPPSAA